MRISIEYPNPTFVIFGILLGAAIAVVFKSVAFASWRKMKSDYQNPS